MKLPTNFWAVLSAVSAVIITVESSLGILNNFGVHPTLPSSQIPFGLLLAFVGLTAFPLWVGYQLGVWRVKRKSQTPESEPSETALNEQTTAVLIRLATLEYRHTLRDQLNYIWKDVDQGWWSARFLIWKNLNPVLKKLLIHYKPEYDALEDFANALDQFSDNDNKADSDALKTLCKNRFERLKELGLIY